MARKRKAAAGSLGEYRRKRDAKRSPEPSGAPEPSGGRKKRRRGPRARPAAPRFVIQEHSARRLHWDLRLERDGVLASWALPKGLPPDPATNHKAVHTEDHPLEYLEFEGEIPAGSYGAGTMSIWDSGTYEAEKFRQDEVILTLRGERAEGRYALFRAGKDERDWMIHRMDEPARPREPMPERLLPMTARRGRLPRDDDAWGYEVDWDGLRLLAYSTPGRIRLLGPCLEEVTGRFPEVRRLNRQLGSTEAIIDGEIVALDEGGRPSPERLAGRTGLRSDSAIRRHAKAEPVIFQVYDLLHLDGASLLDRPYEERRARLEGLELEGEAWRTPAYHRGDGRRLLAKAEELGLPGVIAKRLDSPYRPGGRGDWVQVRSSSTGGESGPDGPTPHPGFDVKQVRARGRTGTLVEVEGRELKLTNLDKVLYPEAGFAKRDVIDYYARIAGTLGPHLKDRPLTLKRYPDGVEGPHFFEKSCPAHRPEWLDTVTVPSERKGQIRFCLAGDLPSLVWLGNLADLELHPSLSRAQELDHPSSLAFDLDPGPGTDLLDCIEVGQLIRGMLDRLGLAAFPKVSGKKGLHLYVPLNGTATYEESKPFARRVAETLEERFADRITAKMAKSRRRGRVLVDWSQNDVHKTTLCVYSLRATARPAVSVPLEWKELERALRRRDLAALVFGPEEALKRVEERGDLFAPVLSLVQELPAT
jgi:bifunctional non-homologous end joining protein LigD